MKFSIKIYDWKSSIVQEKLKICLYDLKLLVRHRHRYLDEESRVVTFKTKVRSSINVQN